MSPATAHTQLWHPFAAMGRVDGHELALTRGEGCRVWDADGNDYLDATAGLWFVNVGHGRAEIADRGHSRDGRVARGLTSQAQPIDAPDTTALEGEVDPSDHRPDERAAEW